MTSTIPNTDYIQTLGTVTPKGQVHIAHGRPERQHVTCRFGRDVPKTTHTIAVLKDEWDSAEALLAAGIPISRLCKGCFTLGLISRYRGLIHQAATKARQQAEPPAPHPPVQGTYRGGHQLWTRDHGYPFDAFRSAQEYGGHALVVIDGWCVSYPHGSHIDGVRLSAHRRGERHELDGTHYPTVEDARRAAWEAGLLAFMVYRLPEPEVAW